eukprot:gene6585-9402_t
MADSPVFSQQSMLSPGIMIPSTSPNDILVTLRIYGGAAILSPGAEYKSILARQDTTAVEVISQVLERYDAPGDPGEFELRSVLIDQKTGKVKRQSSFSKLLRSRQEHTITLDSDMSPVLFADWYGDENRRFELHLKEHREQSPNISRQRSSFFRSIRRKRKNTAPNFNAQRDLHTVRQAQSAIDVIDRARLGGYSFRSNGSVDHSDDASSTIAEVGEVAHSCESSLLPSTLKHPVVSQPSNICHRQQHPLSNSQKQYLYLDDQQQQQQQRTHHHHHRYESTV